MRYTQFKIIKYKSISSTLTVDINRNKLLPIIGENECGKTTILKAIFAFDYSNDTMLNSEHISNTKNQYNPADSNPSKISATIKLDNDDKERYVDIIKEHSTSEHQLNSTLYDSVIKNQPDELIITRYFNGEKYYLIDDEVWKNEPKETQDKICKKIIDRLPHIVYFDDFLESIPDEIIITEENKSSWQETMDLLLNSVDTQYSTTTLKDREENAIYSIQSDVSKKLTSTITQKWTQMRLDTSNNFTIKFIFDKTKPSIKLKVVETVEDNKERAFDVRQRSKGFYWFFNFVIKSEFNPKTNSKKVLFLLDEPGAYLHVAMQKKLCEKLAELAKLEDQTSGVIYCTHSHNLLEPQHIDISSIHVCYKQSDGNIAMQGIADYANNPNVKKQGKYLAFEPIYHVLGVSDILINGTRDNILLTEGINDFYTFQMMKESEINLSFLPSTNANHIQYSVPIFLASGKKFMCLYDSDSTGDDELNRLKKIFGEDVKNIAFKSEDVDYDIVESEKLYDEEECENVQKSFFCSEQKINTKKLVKRIFFAKERDKILEQMPKTKKSVSDFLKKVKEKFEQYYN